MDPHYVGLSSVDTLLLIHMTALDMFWDDQTLIQT